MFDKEEAYEVFNSEAFRELCRRVMAERENIKEYLCNMDFSLEGAHIRAAKYQGKLEGIDYIFETTEDIKSDAKGGDKVCRAEEKRKKEKNEIIMV
jgi:hypothetical protein